MVRRRYVPDRGDVVWLIFSPAVGHEQTGRRPAVVISPAAYNRRVGWGLFCPITAQEKGYPFEVHLPSGLPIGGVVLSDHVKNLDWRARRATLACRLPGDVVGEVLGKLGALISP